MNWDRIKDQLEGILDTPMKWNKWQVSDWNRMTGNITSSLEKSVMHKGHVVFALYREGSFIHGFEIDESAITPSERMLLEMTLEVGRPQDRKNTGNSASDDERKASAVKEWLEVQLHEGKLNAEMPERLAASLGLYSGKIPILINGDYSDNRMVMYMDLKKLLESFFDNDIILLPLVEKEWFVLVDETVLQDNEGNMDREFEEETQEDSLASLSLGLYEMMASEGIGECHIAIGYPIVPVKFLLPSLAILRETIALGRTYRIGSHLHLPWQLHLEKLLNTIPEGEKSKFLVNVLKGSDYLLDSETMLTLESFFELECNVSETAKKLYIHRNTLLYRLDKFKQETGLDVRTFGHAVLVRIALLLYKVTKRK